jgi:hypothetical protein
MLIVPNLRTVLLGLKSGKLFEALLCLKLRDMCQECIPGGTR